MQSKGEPKEQKEKLRIGLMRYSKEKRRFMQAKFQTGGGLRVVEVSGKEDVTGIKEVALKVFYPNEKKNANSFFIGTFDGKELVKFTTTDGEPCSYSAYLKSHGLFASRYHLYLMERENVQESQRTETSDNTPSPIGENESRPRILLSLERLQD